MYLMVLKLNEILYSIQILLTEVLKNLMCEVGFCREFLQTDTIEFYN